METDSYTPKRDSLGRGEVRRADLQSVEFAKACEVEAAGQVFANARQANSRNWRVHAFYERWKKLRCVALRCVACFLRGKRDGKIVGRRVTAAWLNSLCNCTVWRAEERTRIL
jgi:hypothetical protein